MPGMDGITLAEQIKLEKKLANIRLVLLTSYIKRGHAQESMKAWFSAYLSKPIRQSQLFEVLSIVLGMDEQNKDKVQVSRHTIKKVKKDKKIHILVAEDNPVNQKVAAMMLEKMGCAVDGVADGQEALDAIKKLPYDLILMDVQMPVMDGLTATRKIRELFGDKVIIVAMTANAMPGDKEKCLKAGMNDYIAKPVRTGDLQKVIEKWVG
jgi:CheY-like chemotaxis protein